MKKRNHLHTNFIKFILEKYKKEIQDLPDEESNKSNKNLEDEFDEILNDNEVPEKEEDDNNENIDTLLKEYLMLEKKYKTKKNDSLFKRK